VDSSQLTFNLETGIMCGLCEICCGFLCHDEMIVDADSDFTELLQWYFFKQDVRSYNVTVEFLKPTCRVNGILEFCVGNGTVPVRDMDIHGPLPSRVKQQMFYQSRIAPNITKDEVRTDRFTGLI
jgi:hypothetical protein